MNALSAICVGIENDIEVEDIINGIKEFELSKNRMEVTIRPDKVKIINDSYNASYDSMKAALETLSRDSGNKKIAILRRHTRTWRIYKGNT